MEREKLIQLVIAAQRGDAVAKDTLFSQVYDDVYHFALKTVKDHELACDITQETFVELLDTLGNLQEPAAFVKWVKQITYHQCTRYFKKKKEVLVEEDEEGNNIFDIVAEARVEFIPDEALDQKDFRNTILAMLNELSEEQRSATMLYYYNELPVKEIAQIQDVSEGTVKSRLNYARKSLKSAVESYEKKNNVKLHSFGFLPIMLWLFKSTAEETAAAAAAAPGIAAGVTAATGVTITATTAASASVATVATATTAATTVAATTSAVTTTASATAVGAGTVAKAAAVPLITKLIAGATAGVIVLGGASVAIYNHIHESETMPSEPTHVHTWVEATCETPRSCASCGEMEGIALGHQWLEASCEYPKSCSVCGATEGEALGHRWQAATCQNLQNCLTCGLSEGELLAHNYVDDYCAVCGKWQFSEGLEYILTDDGYVVSGVGTCIDTDILITPNYQGLPVVAIGNRAFSGCGNITSIVIPEGVKKIEYGAFSECSNLREITIPATVEYMHPDAFRACNQLCTVRVDAENMHYCVDDQGVLFDEAKTELLFIPATVAGVYVVPDTVVQIWNWAICDDAAFTEIWIPASVKDMDGVISWDCINLQRFEVARDNPYYSSDEYGVLFDKEKTELLRIPCQLSGEYTIPDSVEKIRHSAFRKCTNLTQVTLSAGLTVIENSTFWECSGLTSIVIPEGVTTINSSAFCYCDGLVSVWIPDSVTEIGSYAFYGCNNLQNVVFGENSRLETIGAEAFVSCQIVEIFIPAGVKDLGAGAFSNCILTQRFNVAEDNQYYSSDEWGVLYDKTKQMLICAPGQLSGSYVIPDGVTTICDEAFSKCAGLTDITIPATVTSMGEYVFCECTGLASVIIPESVTVIGDHAFMNCINLTSVSIPTSVTLIDQYAFFSCGRLESITFEGTMAQWEEIEKVGEWKYAVPATEVICTDGSASLQ